MNRHSSIARTGTLWLMALVIGAAALPASGAPMNGDVITIRQPDGTSVVLRVWGDEFYAVGETEDGYTVIRDPKSGMHCYAALSADGRALVSTGVPLAQPAPAALGKHIRIDATAAREKARISREVFERATLDDPYAPGRAAPTGPTTGEVLGLTLIIDFSDDVGTITPGTIDNFCNLIGFTGYGNNGSVRDYYYDVSNHLLTYTNHVPTSYYRASHPKSYYTDPNISYGQRARELIAEALTALNPTLDYSQFDADSNGIIDALNCFYAGDRWNNWAEGLWPHASSMNWCGDGVCTNRYQITNIGSSLLLGTFCHENGHMLMNWPDLYDYDFDSTGVGNFCLMCYGGPDDNPVQPCAYMKYKAGWASVTLPGAPQAGISVPSTGNVMYKFNYAGHPNEYYLIDNRQQTGRDAGIPDNGLAIWHVDTYGSNNNQQQTPSLHYLVTLVQADGRWDMEDNANAGDATDLYAAPTYTACAPETYPNTDWWDGTVSGLAFTNIGASGATMTFDYGHMPPPRPEDVVAVGEELSVSLTWDAVPISDLDYYRIERDTTALFGSGTVSMTSDDPAYADGPLGVITEYFYRVFAVNLFGLESDASDIVSATPFPNAPPSLPTGLVTWGGSGRAEVQWTANPELDIIGYHVVRDSLFAFAHAETLGFTAGTSFADTTCPLNRSYWYRIVAEDATDLRSDPTAPVAGIAVSGETVYVDASNTGPETGTLYNPYRTIGSGITNAAAGDAVIVFPGSYGGPVVMKNDVPLIGMRGTANTSVTAPVSATAIDGATTLKGFLVDGLGTVTVGLDCAYSSLIVEDCEFTRATTAGVSCGSGGTPLIRRNHFTGNARGIRCVGSGALIVSNTFVSNSSSDITNSGSPSPVVGGSLARANDFLEPGTRAIANLDSLPVAAEYNYWGDDCVDPSWFTGPVDYTPWTDETHTLVFQDCWVGVPEADVPLAAYASPSYPNPSSRGTSIAFGLPGSGGAVSLRIYDVSGRLVRTLVDRSLPGGNHLADWDGRDERGERVSSGVYFYALRAPGFEGQGRMVVLK